MYFLYPATHAATSDQIQPNFIRTLYMWSIGRINRKYMPACFLRCKLYLAMVRKVGEAKTMFVIASYVAGNLKLM